VGFNILNIELAAGIYRCLLLSVGVVVLIGRVMVDSPKQKAG
jgi:hypothetical protein